MKNKKMKDLGNLPVPVDHMDEHVQRAVAEIPLECPLCHAKVDGFFVDGSFSYSRETSSDMFVIPTSYTWEGRCQHCYIRWNLHISKRGF